MDIYLFDPAGERFHFPVNPEEITIRRDKPLETVNLLTLGEIDFPQGEKVKEISFSSFFPRTYDPSYCRYPDVPEPQSAMNRLTALMNAGQPLRLLIAGTAVNALVYLTAHTSTMKGGEPGDVYYEVAFRTYRELKARTSPSAAGGTARPDTKPVPKVYQVKPGDSLWAIAKRELGDSGRWKQLYEINKTVVGPDPNAIRPGQKLVMP